MGILRGREKDLPSRFVTNNQSSAVIPIQNCSCQNDGSWYDDMAVKSDWTESSNVIHGDGDCRREHSGPL